MLDANSLTIEEAPVTAIERDISVLEKAMSLDPTDLRSCHYLAPAYALLASYSELPQRRQLGHNICNQLAFDLDAPELVRDVARDALFRYTQSLSERCGSLRIAPLPFTPPDLFRAFNPSIMQHNGGFLVSIRCINSYKDYDGVLGLCDRNWEHYPPGAPNITRVFLLKLGHDLQPRGRPIEIDFPGELRMKRLSNYGIEDIRLFQHDGKVRCTGSHGHEAGHIEIVTAEIDVTSGRFKDVMPITPRAEKTRDEKNWMPILGTSSPEWIYMCDPFCTIDESGFIKPKGRHGSMRGFRGGSQAVPFDGGHLCIIHEKRTPHPVEDYQHRFLWFSETQIKASRRFYLIEKGTAEFVAGLAWHPDGARMVFTFGAKDRDAYLATVDADDVRAFIALPG